MSAMQASRATDHLLAAIFHKRAPGRLRHSFMFGKPGAPVWSMNFGVEINYDHGALVKATLYVRRYGAPHLRSLSVSRVEGFLRAFVSDNFGLLQDEALLGQFEGSFADHLSQAAKDRFAAALTASSIFVAPDLMTLFPLDVIEAGVPFVSDRFFIVAPGDLYAQLQSIEPDPREVVSTSFPPIRRWDGRRTEPKSWLGVRTPTTDAALQMRAAILGAIALLPHPMERHLFSGRKINGGRATLSKGWTITSDDPHTPPLSENIVLADDDRNWLNALAAKLTSPAKADRKQLRALEYFYRAWVPDEVKRFPTFFGALDAIFGDAGAATQAVIDAVGPIMGPKYDYERLKLLLSLRASVIHGGAPNVYESSSYGRYYEKYGADAVRDLELMVARCLQQVVFPGSFKERAHTYGALIKREMGIDV